ncbi:MAG TPA: class II fructose-bisphosphate aldolase, partial [Thermoflexia bacterium]|nr:class II fructose-bisphosphate aldolase [Thermoflexia bacterium]
MMLVTSKELLLDAQKNGYAVGAFNTNNLEITHAIIRAAEVKQAPVLIQISSGALRYAGLHFLPMIVCRAAERASVPVAVHLDHGPDFKTVMEALSVGFTSIMRDASKLPYVENVAEVRKVVEACHAIGIPVEAEIGRLVG